MTGITVNIFCKTASILVKHRLKPEKYPQGEIIEPRTHNGITISGEIIRVIKNTRQNQWQLIISNHNGDMSVGGDSEK